MGGGVRNIEGLNELLFSILNAFKKDLGVQCDTTNNANICFGELIRAIYEKNNELL